MAAVRSLVVHALRKAGQHNCGQRMAAVSLMPIAWRLCTPPAWHLQGKEVHRPRAACIFLWSACCGSEMCETTGDTRALARVCVVDKAGRTVLQVSLELGVLVSCPCEWVTWCFAGHALGGRVASRSGQVCMKKPCVRCGRSGCDCRQMN